MEHARNFDKQNYDKSIVDYIGKTLEETLVGKILTNQNIANHSSNLSDFSTVNYLQ